MAEMVCWQVRYFSSLAALFPKLIAAKEAEPSLALPGEDYSPIRCM